LDDGDIMTSISRKIEQEDAEERRRWSFLTNHARVLLAIAGNADMTLREIGDAVGITERATHRIVDELATAGYLERGREGRRNRYSVHTERALADPVAGTVNVGALLDALRDAADPRVAR
jgi:DNA-binding MarR family transcriptional regulator